VDKDVQIHKNRWRDMTLAVARGNRAGVIFRGSFLCSRRSLISNPISSLQS
jgi:hypothetical protein